MLRILSALATSITQIFRSRRDLLLENLALRQQLAVLIKKRPWPRLSMTDMLFLDCFAPALVRMA
jgi:hypothetical protein